MLYGFSYWALQHTELSCIKSKIKKLKEKHKWYKIIILKTILVFQKFIQY